MHKETDCEICGSKYQVVRGSRSPRFLCKRCLYWQNFQGLINQGDEDSTIISKQLNSCYPNNVEKQKDLFIAIIEILDEVGRDHAISDDTLIRIAMKWQVERVVCEKMIKAVTESSSLLLKKAPNQSVIPDEENIQTD